MRTNPIVLEMLMQRFRSVAEEMGYSVQRTGYTAFVNETADLGVALVTPKGEIFGYPSGIGITTFVNLDMSDAFGAFDAYDEGDIVVTNDPYTSGAMSSHLPDVNVFRPVFHDGGWCASPSPTSIRPTSAATSRAASRPPTTRCSRKASAFRRSSSTRRTC